jgi:hypothetical protein
MSAERSTRRVVFTALKIDCIRTKVNQGIAMRAFLSRFLVLFLLLPAPSLLLPSCSSSKDSARHDRVSSRDADEEEHEEEEERMGAYNAAEASAPENRDVTITLEPVEAPSDTIRFHIGSPVFIRMKIKGDVACEPFDGRPFFFDSHGSQLGWGFEEVADSLLFPRHAGSCDRVIMLSSDASNRIAEGNYTLTVTIFIDTKKHLYSDTLQLQAIRSGGADQLSYTRFLQEQIIRNSPLLKDPETLRALFSDGAPRSAESEIYRALIFFRSGDRSQAQSALESATALEAARNRMVTGGPADTRSALVKTLHGDIVR